MKKQFHILALDGGGIRGIATAVFLAEIEKQLDRPLCDYFDLITGTSTAALLRVSYLLVCLRKPPKHHIPDHKAFRLSVKC